MRWQIPFVMLLQGCSIFPSRSNTGATSPFSTLDGVVNSPTTDACQSLAMLSWIGGLSILGGIAALVITRGSMGMRAVAIGVGLVLLNYAVSQYAHAIFIPILVGTGIVSVTYAFVVVRNAMKKKSELPTS